MSILKQLVQSRKFWLALVSVIVAAVLTIRGQLSVENFVDAVLVLVSVLMATIAWEDGANAQAQSEPPKQTLTVVAPTDDTAGKTTLKTE